MIFPKAHKIGTVKGILFDKDGTLIDFPLSWHPIAKNIFLRLSQVTKIPKKHIDSLQVMSGFLCDGFEVESLFQTASRTKLADIWADYLHSVGIHADRQLIYSIFEKCACDEQVQFCLLKGVKELLLFLKDFNVPMGIVTADIESSTFNSLAKSGISEFFTFVACDNGKYHLKPHPEAAEQFCGAYGISHAELLVVGDSQTDMEFAENIGAKFIGVKGQYNDYGLFMKKGYCVVDDLCDITKLIELQ